MQQLAAMTGKHFSRQCHIARSTKGQTQTKYSFGQELYLQIEQSNYLW